MEWFEAMTMLGGVVFAIKPDGRIGGVAIPFSTPFHALGAPDRRGVVQCGAPTNLSLSF